MREVLIRLASLLAALVLLVAVVANTGDDPATVISTFSTRFLGIFIEAAPFLLLGTLVSGLIEAFVSRETVANLIPRQPVLATLVGAFMGFAFPVCECGVVPVVRRLFNKGLPMSVGVTFLLAAPFMNPIVMLSTYAAFGFGPVLIGRFVITALVAVSVGLLFAFRARPQEVLRPHSMPAIAGASGEVIPLYVTSPHKTLPTRMVGALRLAGDEFFEMGRYLILGSLLAAGMQTLFQQDVLLSLGQGPIISVLALQALAFVLSVCSTVDAFLALAFAGTFTTGSILAFLTFGPMVDIKSTLMFLGVFRRKVVVYLVVLPLLMTMLIAIWINLNIAF